MGYKRRCGGSLSSDGGLFGFGRWRGVRVLLEGGARAANRGGTRQVNGSGYRETLALVDALEDDYLGSLSTGELENATLLWRVQLAAKHGDLVCSMD